MSSLAWIDLDKAERPRAHRIMALFQERESRDRLGLGSVAVGRWIARTYQPPTTTVVCYDRVHFRLGQAHGTMRKTKHIGRRRQLPAQSERLYPRSKS